MPKINCACEECESNSDSTCTREEITIDDLATCENYTEAE